MGVRNVIPGPYVPHSCALPNPNDHTIGTLLQCDVCELWWMNADYSFQSSQAYLWVRVRWYNINARGRIRQYEAEIMLAPLREELAAEKVIAASLNKEIEEIDEWLKKNPLTKPPKLKE